MSKINLPLYGIIYNWKGLKEENYLYTGEELQRFDPELFEACNEQPGIFHDSTKVECAWKTWMGIRFDTEDDVKDFLSGGCNAFGDEDSDWYWENALDNDLYGEQSYTLIDVYTAVLGGE